MKVSSPRTIRVGDTLWRDNHYDRRQGDPLFESVVIVGETPVSWLYAPFGEGASERVRISKKTMLTKADWRGHRDHYYTDQERKDLTFARAWAGPLSKAVRDLTDRQKLQQIADIVGLEIA